MIRILGLRRIIMLSILVLLDIVLLGALYGYMSPQKEQKNIELMSLKGEISTQQADISRMQVEYNEIQKQKARFQALESDGFFRDQSRREAEDLLKRIQMSSGVVSAVASIGGGKVKDDAEATKAGYKILQSDVDLTIEALDDVDIYRYIYMLQHNFPGYLTYEKMDMSRLANIDATILRGVATGSAVPLVKAELKMTWKTMIPDSLVKVKQGTDISIPQ